MNNKPETKIGYVSPIKRICMSIGELPTSYLETMSYYEMLIWFVEFLKNNVIPVVNNNSEATEELQNLFIELQNYVNNYFDNLDVQDEINNKLDKMLADGSLEQIIEQYLNSTALWCFDNVADMKKSTNLINGSYARTLGYAEINDSYGGIYYITNTITDNNDNIVENLNNGLYGIKIFDKTNPSINDFRKFCTIEANYLNWTEAFKFAITNYESIKLESDNYYITDTLTINKEGFTIKGNNTLTSRIVLIPKSQMSTNYIIKLMNNNIELRDFYLQGSETENDYTNNGVYIYGGQIKITNIKIRHIKGSGITFEFPSYDCVINNVQVYDCTNNGMVINATDCQFNECYVHDVGRHGFEILRGSNFFNNCKAYFTGKINAESIVDAQAGIGFFIHSNDGGTRTIMMSNCHAQECGLDGFRLSNSQGITLENCISDSNSVYSDGMGININNSNYNIIKNCLIVNKQFLKGWTKTALNVTGYYNNVDVIINALDNSLQGGNPTTKFFTTILRGNKSSTNNITINNSNYLPLDYENPMCFDGTTSGIAKDFSKYTSGDSFGTNAFIQRDEKYQVISISGTTAINDEVGIALNRMSVRPSITNVDVSFSRRCSSENGLVVGCKIAWYDSSNDLIDTTIVNNIPIFENNSAYKKYWTNYYNTFKKPTNATTYILSIYLKVESDNSTGSASIKDLKIMYS